MYAGFDFAAFRLGIAGFFIDLLPRLSFGHQMINSCASQTLVSSSLAGTTRRRTESSMVQACSVWVVSNQMEAAMKCLATITGALAIVVAALLASGGAEAGGSVSAASKYGHANQVAAIQARTGRQARGSDFAITEYSSSSAKTRPHGDAYR
jgi:hypothetical protein